MADGLTLMSWADEWENVLGATMLQRGGLLYRDFINSHGPFIFMLSHVYGAAFGWDHAARARLISVLLTVLAAVVIMRSPGLRGTARILALALFAGLLATVWLRQGLFLLSFYPVGGALAGIGLAGFVVGPCMGHRVPLPMAFIAGLAFAMLAATAYSFWPSVMLFIVGGGWAAWYQGQRMTVGYCLAGLSAGGLAVLAYLAVFGDTIGYLTFHIAESQANYSHYIGFSPFGFLSVLELGSAPNQLVRTVANVLVLGSSALFLALAIVGGPGWPVRCGAVLLGMLGVVLLNARGEAGFQNGSFVFASIVMTALAVAHAVSRWADRNVALGALCVVLMTAGAEWRLRPAPYAPYYMDGATLGRQPRWGFSGPSDEPSFKRIRDVVRPDERVLILVYQPWAYLAAGRLPLDGFYTYFPWDADYAKAPWFGRSRDLCATLAASPPPAIVYDDWHVWGYDPHVYMPCLFDILRADYGPNPEKLPFGQLFIRRDRLTP